MAAFHTRVVLRRRTYQYIAVMSLILVSALLFDFYSYNNDIEQESIRVGKEANNSITHQLDSMLNDVVIATELISKKVEEGNHTIEELLGLIESESKAFDFILGVTVAYEPFAFNERMPLFAPYYDKRLGSFIDIADVYDYTDTTLTTAKWYSEVAQTKKAKWSEPYFAQGAQLIVSDYGSPLYKEIDGQKTLIGTVTLTIALERLSAVLGQLSLGSTAYAFLTSSKGVMLAHPTSKYILNVTLMDIGKAYGAEVMAEEVMNEEKGYLEYTSVYTNVDSYLFFNTVPSTGWKSVVVFATDDLRGGSRVLGNKVVNLSLASSFLVIIWLLVLIRINEDTNTKLWVISTVFSVLVVVNIIIIWNLNVNHGYSEDPSDSVKILNSTEMYRYVFTENERLIRLGYDPYMTINTGIYIEEMEFKDSYNVSVRGKIWQKWPIGLDEEFKPGFQFIQQSPALGTSSELVSVKRNEEMYENLYLWEFKTTLRLPLRYLKFPFDSRDVSIEIAYPDLQSNILLVPDMEGYKVLNPSAFPGIKKDIYFPQATMKSSYFSFERIDFHTEFGNTAYNGDNEYPIMEFNVNLKRRFLNAFVSNIIPILVVASMIFLIFYSNSKRKDSNTGVSMMGVVQSCAGFFFVLLMAHIDLRKRIASPDITYLETFYFTMYVMIGLLAINVVAFTKTKDSSFLHYEDNLLVKLAYWPFLLGSWLIITLSRFYN